MSKKKFSPLVLCIILTCILIAFDQYTKYLAVINLKDSDSFVILDGIFEFLYVENRGVAWGAFAGNIPVFIILTFIIIPIVILTIRKIEQIIEFFGNKVNVKALRFIQIDMFIIIAGAIGNLIDRIANGYVIDFLYFKLIDFPVFNIADCYITVSAILFILVGFICLNDDEVDYLTSSKKKWQVKDEYK